MWRLAQYRVRRTSAPIDADPCPIPVLPAHAFLQVLENLSMGTSSGYPMQSILRTPACMCVTLGLRDEKYHICTLSLHRHLHLRREELRRRISCTTCVQAPVDFDAHEKPRRASTGPSVAKIEPLSHNMIRPRMCDTPALQN